MVLDIGLIPLVCMSMLALFIPGRTWDFFERVIAGRFGKVTLYYDGLCGFCRTSVYALSVFLFLPQSQRIPAQEHAEVLALMNSCNSWVVEDKHGVRYIRYHAFLALVRASPVWFWLHPLLSLLPCIALGNKIYTRIAEKRVRICPVPAEKKRSNSLASGLSALGALLFLVLTMQWNLDNLKTTNAGSGHLSHGGLSTFLIPLGLVHSWSFFAPTPLTDRWIMVRVVWPDGGESDPLADWGPFHRGMPKGPLIVRNNWLLTSHFWRLRDGQYDGARVQTARYYCKEALAKMQKQPEKVEVHLFRAAQGKARPNSQVVAAVRCADEARVDLYTP